MPVANRSDNPQAKQHAPRPPQTVRPQGGTGPTSDLVWDPFGPPLADPYPTYRRMRNEAPVYYHDTRDFWAVSRYDDVLAWGRRWDIFSYARGADLDNVGDTLQPGNFLGTDPPLHTVLRNVVKHAFRPREVQRALRAAVPSEVKAVVDDCLAQPGENFVTDVAFALPIAVSSTLLGFPRSDCDYLRHVATAAFLRRIEPNADEPAREAASAIRRYFADQLAERRATGSTSDLLGHIAHAQADAVDLAEAGAGIASVLFAGSVDTTALAISNLVWELWKQPEQRGLLKDEPARGPAAVEEILRWDAPVQAFKRTTTRPFSAYGQTIPADATVILLYGSANRDERRVRNPDVFDILRKPVRHLAFGDGIHHCIGAPIARFETVALITYLLRRAPRYEVTAPPVRLGSSIARGFSELRLAMS